jgi:ribosomal protein S18 acetylase RimI-like enzyme
LERVPQPASLAADVARIHNAAYRQDVAFRIFTREEMAAELSGEQLFAVRDREQIIAFCQISLEPAVVWIESLAVDPAYQGRGIGKALAAQALQYFGGGGDRLAGLNVSSTNSSAKAVYSRLGFTLRRELRRFKAARGEIIAALEQRLPGHQAL